MLMDSSSNSNNVQSYPCPPTINVANFVPTKLWFDFERRSTNYQAWRAQMLCLIEGQGLVGFINGTILPPPPPPPGTVAVQPTGNINDGVVQWRRSDMLLKGWILGSLSDDLITDAASFGNSRYVWLYLQFMFSSYFNQLQPQNVASAATTEPSTTNAEDHNNIIRRGKKDAKEYLPLHRAALQGNWEAAQQIIKDDPASMTANITLIQSTALQIAVGTGKSVHFVENLVGSMPDDSLAVMDDIGSTALTIAAAVGNIEAAIILINRMPNLLYIPNKYDHFPLQHAALYAQKDMLKYLISVTKDDLDVNPYSGLAGLNLLLFVIDAQFFDIALELVERYPDLARLKLQDGTSALTTITGKKSVFCDGRRFTFWERLILCCVSMEAEEIFGANVRDIESLAYNGQTVFQRLCTMPWKFAEGLGLVKKNIKEKMLLKLQALRLVKCLCKNIQSLSFNEAKEIYFEAIMIAAVLGICEIVEEIVEVFPSAINCVRSSRYIFHVAVQYRSEHVFNLVYQMSDHRHLYSDLQDSEGNNVLHFAGKLAPPDKLNEIPGAALQMQREIQWYKEVEKFVHPHARERLNHARKSPSDIFTEEHKVLKEEGEKWMKDTSNSCTIAAALIATVMFAAAITVPGGNDNNDNNKGLPILHTSPAFIVFAVSDAISLFTSATSLLMFLAILTSRYAEQDFLYVLPKRLIIGLGTLFLSITFMMVAFSAAIYLVFARNRAWVLIPVVGLAALPVTSFVLLQFPLLVDLISSTYGRGIFGKQSDRPFY